MIRRTRTIRIATKLPANLWPEIVKTSAYLRNRTPRRDLKWKTPFEAGRQFKPRLVYLNVLRAKVYVLNYNIPKKNKLDLRAFVGHLVRYDSTNIFRV